MKNLQDIAKLATMLEGIRDVREIKFSQHRISEVGTDFNHIQFVQCIKGVYFYTDKNILNMNITKGRNEELPVYVCHKDSTALFEIK